MSKHRKNFSAKFKNEAASLVLDKGYTHAEACESMERILAMVTHTGFT